ncbi:hypothetical protein GCM10020295_24370 [Streptomyces cinereospinus]
MMTTVSWVRPDQLGDYTAHGLGSGGQGRVYAVPSPPGRFQGEYLAYKEYLPALAYDADVLHDMVVLRDLLSPSDRALLDNRLTWPCAMVYTGRPPERLPPSRNAGMRVVGFLMPRVAPSYELHSASLSEVKLQALEFLLNDDGYAARIGLDVGDPPSGWRCCSIWPAPWTGCTTTRSRWATCHRRTSCSPWPARPSAC